MGMVPEPLRLWSLSPMAIAAWGVAGAVGYVLWIRPKWYPEIRHETARTFTPKEVRPSLLTFMCTTQPPTHLAQGALPLYLAGPCASFECGIHCSQVSEWNAAAAAQTRK